MTKQDEIIKVVDAVEEAQKIPDNEIRLSTGVVLRAKKANPLVMIRVMSAFPRPKPPTWISPKMGREMENPDDPEYRAQLQSWQMESGSALLNAMILLGTELVSVPKDFPGPHPTKKKGNNNGQQELEWPEWIEEYEFLGIPMHASNQSWRYLTWVMFKAASNEKDFDLIKEKVGRLSGISEEAVKSAEDFPGSE